MSFFARLKRKIARNWLWVKYAGLATGVFFLIIIFFKISLGVFSRVPAIFVDPIETLKNDGGRINILVLGVGGTNHDGSQMTDTMMVVSLPASESGKIFLISVPRDIYLDYLGDKINIAYSQGEEKKPGSGLVLAKAVTGQVTGLPLHYAVKFDFSAFSQIVDLLGGIDVEVENSFTDEMYPLPGKENDNCSGQDPDFLCRYETISFTKGLNHMAGATALKFARSRHSVDLIEGTDYSRSKRQQKIIQAIRKKALSLNNLLDFKNNIKIYDSLKSNIQTDVSEKEFEGFFKLALKIKDLSINSLSLDENLLYNPPIDPVKGWYLIPKNGGFEDIHNFLKQELGK